MKKVSCRKCGVCCNNLGKLRIHKSEAGALGHFRTVGASLKELPVEGVYVFEGGKCPFVSHNGCKIHEEKPLICKAHPFVVGMHNVTKEPTIVLWASNCPDIRDHIREKWVAAPKRRAPVVAEGRFAEVETAEIKITQEEIDGNPYLRDSFGSAADYLKRAHGRDFKKGGPYNVVIAFSPNHE